LSAVQIGPFEPVGPLKMDRFGPASSNYSKEKQHKMEAK
jgi:hypothetical protein